MARSSSGTLPDSIRAWAPGRNPWIRLPVLLWLAWILVRYWPGGPQNTVFAGIDLVLHEAGHIIFSPFGEFLEMAGGTLAQLLLPAAAGYALYRQRDWFGVAFAVCWVGINCFEAAVYAGDALARRLTLVSPAGTTSPRWR